MSVYQYAGNNPIMANDRLGNEESADDDDPDATHNYGWVNIYTAGANNIGVAEQILNLVKNGGDLYVSPGGSLGFEPNDNQVGRVYTIDEYGNIKTTDQTTSGPSDRLVSGENSIDVDQNSVDLKDFRKGTNLDGTKYDYWQIYDQATGYKLFYFVADNTKVEWQLVLGEENYLATDHEEGWVMGGIDLAIKETEAYGSGAVSLLLHSHPHDSPPSGYEIFNIRQSDQGVDEGSDRLTALYLLVNYNITAVTQVYVVPTREIYDMTLGQIHSQFYEPVGGQQPGQPWNSVGPDPIVPIIPYTGPL